MTSFLITDIETTGTDPEDVIVELGAVLFDVGLGLPVRTYSTLIAGTRNDAFAVNRIPPAALALASAATRERAVTSLQSLAALDTEVYALAHNASFDRQWLPELQSMKWICTYEDATWPRHHKETGSLVDLALAYDLGVARAHRAVEDCLLLSALLSRVHELEGGLGAWLERALEEKKEVIAEVTYRDNQKAKDAGFRWDPERKVWHKKLRVSQLEATRASYSFTTRLS